jgi:hypothetical protein
MNKEEILENLRKERPNQVIHEVIDYEKCESGNFYNVCVLMQSNFLGTLVNKTKLVLPYPYDEFTKMSEEDQNHWMMDTASSKEK